MILIGAAIAYSAYDSYESQTRLQNEGRIVQGIIDWITPENFTSTEVNARLTNRPRDTECTRVISVQYQDSLSQTQHLNFKNCNLQYALGQNIDVTRVTSVPEFAVLTKDVISPNHLALYLGVGGGLALSLLAAFAVIYFRFRPIVEQPK